MGSILWTLVAFVVALGILISVHEFGHFWMARRCGVWVERFSIGFGPILWRRQDRLGTEFVIAAIPLGGYVKMLDGRNETVPEHRYHLAFNHKTVAQRAAIIAAGPTANFIFAIFAYWLVFMHGVPGIKPVIGQISPGSIAAQAEIPPAMELKSIDGIETPDWESVRMALVGKIGDQQAELSLAPFGGTKVQHIKLDLRHWQFDSEKQDPVTSLGILPKGPVIETTLAQVQDRTPAQQAGLQAGDRIVKVNDEPLVDWQQFVVKIRDNPNQALIIQIERQGRSQWIQLTPSLRPGTKEGFAGLIPKVQPLPDAYQTLRQYGPVTAVGVAVTKSWQLVKLTASMLVKLVTGDIKLKNLSGPISIAQGAGVSAEYGVIYYLMFLALISVNLGIINLVPLPVLDGGHLLFLLMEKINGQPVSERVQDISYRIGSIALMLLMGLALFNDFSRL